MALNLASELQFNKVPHQPISFCEDGSKPRLCFRSEVKCHRQWVMRGWSLICLIIGSVYLGRRRLVDVRTIQPAYYYPPGHAIQLFESHRPRISFVRSNPWSVHFCFNGICDPSYNRYVCPCKLDLATK